jgi:hypothetical protein
MEVVVCQRAQASPVSLRKKPLDQYCRHPSRRLFFRHRAHQAYLYHLLHLGHLLHQELLLWVVGVHPHPQVKIQQDHRRSELAVSVTRFLLHPSLEC